MNIAVLSDIHGNHIALEVCMAYLEKRHIDACCFLGDYVGEFPGIEKVMNTLYDLQKKMPCYLIRGNKEDYQLSGLGDGHPEWDAYPSTVGMIRYGNRHLTQKDLSFISALPISECVQIKGMQDIRICHGSPRKVNEHIYAGKAKNEEIFAAVKERYILCGHTHEMTNAQEHSKVIWNPGSVGLPLEGGAKAKFLILHGEEGEWRPEFVALDYDAARVIQEMKEADLYRTAPFWTFITESLLKGNAVSHGTVLSKAMEYCVQETGKCDWPKVPETCWEKAYRELIADK